MEPSGSLDENTGKYEKLLGVLKKRSLIDKSDEKTCSNDHALHHHSITKSGNALSLDNDGSLSIQSRLDMHKCTGSPSRECSPPRVSCYDNIRQAGQANGALPIQVITDMSSNSDSKQSVCTPPREPSSDDIAGQTPKTYHEKKYEKSKYDWKKNEYAIYKETKYEEYNTNHDVDKFVVPKFKLKGSFHQGDKRFGMNAGKQCVSNCYTAVIYSKLKNRQEYHIQIRKKIVDHILHISKDLSSFVRDPYENAEEYVRMRKMKESNTWGTELEILAAAHFMQIDIYTFTNNKWIKYSAHQIDTNINVENDAIYLKHNNESSHYEVVLSVEGKREYDILEKTKNIKSISCDFDKLQRNICTDHDINKSNILSNEILEIVMPTDITDLSRKRRLEVEVNVSIDNVKYQRRNNIDSNQVVEDGDLEILDPAVYSGLNYIPLGYKTKRKLCSKFKIAHKNIKETSGVNEMFNMGKPVSSKSIISDGNGLFRALSFAISQRQEYHLQIRKKIVDHILHISKTLHPLFLIHTKMQRNMSEYGK
ncbi:unnamed protein product [Mytilus edulis]|uniref:OTU domain-containing protein n=1 Tax=Mytilus edulis TaxID=6550 RepID=A0A8S3TA81_MYTED|nr:unnamed protein product [Mytilus edulis]